MPGEILVSVKAERNRLLVVNEGLVDGWRAYLDGSPVRLFRANYLVQGVVAAPRPPYRQAGLRAEGFCGGGDNQRYCVGPMARANRLFSVACNPPKPNERIVTGDKC